MHVQQYWGLSCIRTSVHQLVSYPFCPAACVWKELNFRILMLYIYCYMCVTNVGYLVWPKRMFCVSTCYACTMTIWFLEIVYSWYLAIWEILYDRELLLKIYCTFTLIWFWRADQIVTFGISRNTDFKYWNHCGSFVLDCSHTRFTV